MEAFSYAGQRWKATTTAMGIADRTSGPPMTTVMLKRRASLHRKMEKDCLLERLSWIPESGRERTVA